ncbi:hypothetical protein JIN77_02930 [Verrucomicrobiaceae bacterium R5-34]|uniref:Uncharacterized protein n=1 Tax=Oceaniferula flava TaxID=2800421 RepID=A0AAE2VBJ7_9BACT|nr:hypothetical protein [Oceaniferula flavus]MBK1829666.1 hypothetical protein [Verrucomicrobiaceae bacterium R5-34]MBK1853856.1 hypothetical protein [Oceaniferula flavus]MBM1135162.1 hypothetical protein [Oceaniferula flavus]
MKDLTKLIILPLGFVALVGACAPYPPYPGQEPQQQQIHPTPPQQSVADEQQRKLEESRARLRREEERRQQEAQAATPSINNQAKPKPKYPTAAAVPGKPGFVFNPFTHNIVDVKGIGSGKLVKDPEDSDPTHKFRVP